MRQIVTWATVALLAVVAAPVASAAKKGPFRYSLVGHIGSKGTGPGQFDDYSRGVAVDQTCGNVYVVDVGRELVHRYDVDGNLLGDVGAGVLSGPWGLFLQNAPAAPINPEGPPVPCGGAGVLWVADHDGHAIDQFDSSGRIERRWCGDSLAKNCEKVLDHESDGYPYTPSDVWIQGNSAFLAGYYGGFFSQFTLDGTYVRSTPHLAECCVSVAAWAGQVWGALKYANVVDAFSLDPTKAELSPFETIGGDFSSAPGRFKYPQAVATAPDGTLYVAESSRVQVFSPTGKYESQIVLPYGFGAFDVAVRYDGTLYVTGDHSYGAYVYSPGALVKLNGKSGPTIRFTGSVRPAHPRARLVLQRSTAGGWTSFANVRLTKRSTFAYTWHPPRGAANYTVRAYFADPHRYHASRSSNVVTVLSH